jgi:ubiquinol-cytochrome c reductase cytochrome b subunit
VLALMSTVAQVNPIWLYGPYNPVSISAGSQPDFYMGFLEGTLRIFPNWTWDIAGHTVAWNVLVPALVPLGLLFTGAALWPFIERWATGDYSEHHVNDRPRNAPTRTAIGVAAVAFYSIMLLEGANDLIADHLDIPLFTITWIARFAFFLGPAIAYFATKRICLGLQRKDRELLEHGLETGIIRQLPNGEYIEVHRPVSEETRAVLLAKKELPWLPSPGAVDENGIAAPASRGLAGRLRATANRVITESIPLTGGNGAGNGHGSPHGEFGDEAEHAAISTAPDGNGAAPGPAAGEHGKQSGDA